eukprot:5129559-Alexandrium_andersonii.AAC.1
MRRAARPLPPAHLVRGTHGDMLSQRRLRWRARECFARARAFAIQDATGLGGLTGAGQLLLLATVHRSERLA